MLVSFRTKKQDNLINEKLSSLKSNKERGKYVREALNFYIKYKDYLPVLNNKLDDITSCLKEIKETGITVNAANKGENNPKDLDNKDKELQDKWGAGIKDLFGF